MRTLFLTLPNIIFFSLLISTTDCPPTPDWWLYRPSEIEAMKRHILEGQSNLARAQAVYDEVKQLQLDYQKLKGTFKKIKKKVTRAECTAQIQAVIIVALVGIICYQQYHLYKCNKILKKNDSPIGIKDKIAALTTGLFALFKRKTPPSEQGATQ